VNGPSIVIRAEIRRTSDGEVRTYDENYTVDDPIDCAVYQWTLGNYGCDCNRRLFWMRADGQEVFACEPDAPPCTTGLYVVRLLVGDRVLLDEWVES